MQAAVLTTLGQPPRHADFAEPEAGEGQQVVRVLAAGVNHLDLAKATGKFYTGPPPIPSVAGSDGIGLTTDGRRVYFDASVPPYGSWAEWSLVDSATLLDVAAGASDAAAAALGNAGLAAWLGLEWRAELKPGESVLVLGASGAVGGVAVQAARLLGASRVVALDREPRRDVPGADSTVTLADQAETVAALRAAAPEGYDVILDPLWGEPALAAMQAARTGARHVQLGHLAGPELRLPATLVRSRALDIRGMAVFQAPLEVRRRAYLALTGHAARGELSVKVEELPLAAVGEAWQRQAAGPGAKLVLVPGS